MDIKDCMQVFKLNGLVGFLFPYDSLHWRMVSLGFSFFSIHENASWGMYPIPFFAIWGGGREYTSKVVGRTFSWVSSKTSTLPFCSVDLKLEKIVDAKKNLKFNHKTMQVKS